MSAYRPLRAVADFNGLRMRLQPSRVLEAQMKMLRTNHPGDGFFGCLRRLAARGVDGTENPPDNFYTQRMYEVQKHLTVSDHGFLGYAVVVNKKFWDGLPADVRDQLEQAMIEATSYQRVISKKENDEALEKIRATKRVGVYVLSWQKRLEWQKILAPVHKEFEDTIGKDLIRAVYEVGVQVEKEGG